MYCSNCGTKLETGTCAVCGNVSTVIRTTPSTHVGRRDVVTGLALAEWGLRVGASLVDGLILLVPEFLILTAIGNVSSIYFRATALAVQGCYSVYLLSRPRGQTIGNRAAKTRVVNARTGQPLSVTTSMTRWIVIGVIGLSALLRVGALLILLDDLWPLWDSRRQTLHDKIAGTIVVLA